MIQRSHESTPQTESAQSRLEQEIPSVEGVVERNIVGDVAFADLFVSHPSSPATYSYALLFEAQQPEYIDLTNLSLPFKVSPTPSHPAAKVNA